MAIGRALAAPSASRAVTLVVALVPWSEARYHRVSHVAVESVDHQVLRRKDGRGRSDSLKRKASEGLEKYGNACGDRERPHYLTSYKAGERRMDLPPGDAPRHEPGDGSGGEQEKNRGSQQGEHAPKPAICFPCAVGGHLNPPRSLMHWTFATIKLSRRAARWRLDPETEFRPGSRGDRELYRGMVHKWVTASGGWGRCPEGDAPRSRACALGARRLLPARPQPPVFQAQTCTMRPRFAPLQTHLEQKETKATKSKMPAYETSRRVRFACPPLLRRDDGDFHHSPGFGLIGKLAAAVSPVGSTTFRGEEF